MAHKTRKALGGGTQRAVLLVTLGMDEYDCHHIPLLPRARLVHSLLVPPEALLATVWRGYGPEQDAPRRILKEMGGPAGIPASVEDRPRHLACRGRFGAAGR